MYHNNFNSAELLSNPDEVVNELVHCVKEWNVDHVDHTVVEGLGIQEDKWYGFRMSYVPFGWKERRNEKEIAKHDTIWTFWDPYPIVKTLFKNEKESLDKDCVKKHIQEMIFELQKTVKEQNVTKKKDAIISASKQFEI